MIMKRRYYLSLHPDLTIMQLPLMAITKKPEDSGTGQQCLPILTMPWHSCVWKKSEPKWKCGVENCLMFYLQIQLLAFLLPHNGIADGVQQLVNLGETSTEEICIWILIACKTLLDVYVNAVQPGIEEILPKLTD